MLVMVASTISDCIVLKIVETELESCENDNTIYILFDNLKHEFVIRGIRNSSYTTEYEPYSFRCNNIKTLCDFISVVIDNINIISYSFYNLNNLPCYSNDITIELLDESCCKVYEIVGYDNMKFNMKRLRKYISIVYGLFNHYSIGNYSIGSN